MKYSIIHLNPDRLDLPLMPLYAGKLSSAVWIVDGAPDDIDSLAVLIGRTPGETGESRDDFSVAATRLSCGLWRAYISPFCFPDVSQSLDYNIVGTDSAVNPRWLGTGQLRVSDCPADGSPITPPIIPVDTYIRNPLTGLYHKLTADVNELGELTTTIDPEGIQR